MSSVVKWYWVRVSEVWGMKEYVLWWGWGVGSESSQEEENEWWYKSVSSESDLFVIWWVWLLPSWGSCGMIFRVRVLVKFGIVCCWMVSFSEAGLLDEQKVVIFRLEWGTGDVSVFFFWVDMSRFWPPDIQRRYWLGPHVKGSIRK